MTIFFRNYLRPVGLAVFTLALCGAPFKAAEAALVSLSYTDTVASQATNWTNAVSFQQADPSQYQLQSLAITISGTASTLLDTYNGSPTSEGFFYNFQTDFSLTLPSGSVLQLTGLDVDYNRILASKEAYYEGKGISDSVTYYLTDPAVLAAFIGLGSVSMTLNATTDVSEYTTGPGLSSTYYTNADAAITVAYQLSTVPLPAALPLFGAALTGFGGLAYRRKIKKSA